MQDKILAIIPARISSRRLQGKNFIDWFGRPIIESVVEEAEKSELFDKIVISTDFSMKHLGCLEQYKFRRRNPEVLKYESTVDDVCLEVVNYEKEQGKEYEYICCIYPTAYAVKAVDIKSSWNQMHITCLHPDSPPTIETIPFCCAFGMLNSKVHNLEYSCDNGGFYWAEVDEFLKQGILMGKEITRYEIPMVDINTYEDYIDAMAHRLSMTDYLKKKDCKCGI